MIKIIATIGSISEIIEVKNVPPNLKKFIEDRKNAKIENKLAINFSLLEEEIPDKLELMNFEITASS